LQPNHGHNKELARLDGVVVICWTNDVVPMDNVSGRGLRHPELAKEKECQREGGKGDGEPVSLAKTTSFHLSPNQGNTMRLKLQAVERRFGVEPIKARRGKVLEAGQGLRRRAADGDGCGESSTSLS
jgi:hypothetical protein